MSSAKITIKYDTYANGSDFNAYEFLNPDNKTRFYKIYQKRNGTRFNPAIGHSRDDLNDLKSTIQQFITENEWEIPEVTVTIVLRETSPSD